jgi:hypothetical protein
MCVFFFLQRRVVAAVSCFYTEQLAHQPKYLVTDGCAHEAALDATIRIAQALRANDKAGVNVACTELGEPNPTTQLRKIEHAAHLCNLCRLCAKLRKFTVYAAALSLLAASAVTQTLRVYVFRSDLNDGATSQTLRAFAILSEPHQTYGPVLKLHLQKPGRNHETTEPRNQNRNER